MTTVSLSGGGGLDRKLSELAAKVSRPATLRVGFLEGSTYPDGTPVAQIAAIQNFGASHIPARPFFTNFIRRYRGTWGARLAKILEFTDWDAERALGIMGAEMEGQLKQQIRETNEPPLSEVTLMLRAMRRGRKGDRVTLAELAEAYRRVQAGDESGVSGTEAKPLVWTGTMLGAVSHEVTTS